MKKDIRLSEHLMSMKNYYFNQAKTIRCVKHLSWLIAIGLAFFLFQEPLLISYGEWLAPSTPEPTGDVAVALGNGTRIETAATLLVKGRVKAIYSDSDISLNAQSEQETLAQLIAKYKLLPEQIYWGGKVKNTFDEALAFRSTLKIAGFKLRQIVIVSERYHLRRAQWAFRQVLEPDITIQTYPTPANNAMSDPYWWHHKQSRDWVESETRKLIFYWLYYGFFGSQTPLSLREFAVSINEIFFL